jgi:methylase of polypeptide subunit release factors
MPVTRFGDLAIEYDDRVLTPREWTRQESEWAAALSPGVPAGPILELCSGAGHIGLLALAEIRRAGEDRSLVCVDVAPGARELTLRNAAAAGLAPAVDARCADLRSALGPEERFPLVIADPPWVPRAQTLRFPQDPLLAIDGGEDGLAVARECVQVLGRHLARGGAAVLQLGSAAQADAPTPSLDLARLAVGEVRTGERGVLVRVGSVA